MSVYEDFDRICHENGFNILQIKGHRRDWKSVTRRWKVARALRALDYSYPEIGRAMSKHHTSIIYMVDEKHRERKLRLMNAV